ncbi:uncharacterized protein DS421_13g445900 [Arachis hypogaea]|nr:uncharacterized protein DS421_13g445900 [Arachis hypogaea]
MHQYELALNVSDLLDFISPELDSNGNEQAQRKQQILLPISEQNLQREDAPSNVGVVYNGLEYATGMAENKTKERSGMVDYEVMNENGNNVPMYSPPVSSESIHQEETSSDEGWQEANSKGRSRNTANHKLGRRGSHLSKLRTTVIRESPQKSSSRVLSKVLSPSRQSEPENLAFIEDSAGQLNKQGQGFVTLALRVLRPGPKLARVDPTRVLAGPMVRPPPDPNTCPVRLVHSRVTTPSRVWACPLEGPTTDMYIRGDWLSPQGASHSHIIPSPPAHILTRASECLCRWHPPPPSEVLGTSLTRNQESTTRRAPPPSEALTSGS